MPIHTDEKRIALVIGNSQYTREGQLPNARRDATAVAEALTELGFDVKVEHNLRFEAFRDVVDPFSHRAREADIAVTFYAGHAFARNGKNYLVPVDMEPAQVENPLKGTYALDNLTDSGAKARKLTLVVLDACRANPFAVAETRAAEGLARPPELELGSNLLIAYAAKAGQRALEGAPDGHSPYTRALLDCLAMPGLEIHRLFRRVSTKVQHNTNGLQNPHCYSNLGDIDIVLRPSQDDDDALFANMDKLGKVDAYRTYLGQWPKGRHAAQARQAIQILERKGGAVREVLTSPAEIVRAWQTAEISNSIASYKLYLDIAPETPDVEGRRTTAQSRIDDRTSNRLIDVAVLPYGSRIEQLAFAGDRRLVCACHERSLYVWDWPREPKPIEIATPVTGLAIGRSPTVALVGGQDGAISVVELDGSRAKPKAVPVHSGPVRVIEPILNGKFAGLALTCGQDRSVATIRIDGRAGFDKTSIDWTHDVHEDQVISIVVSPLGDTGLTGGRNGEVKLWDLERRTATVLQQPGLTGPIERIVLVGENARYACWVSVREGLVHRFDTVTQQFDGTFCNGHTMAITAIAGSPDGRRLITGDAVGALKIWDATTLRIVAELQPQDREITQISISSSGHLAAVGDTQSTVRVLDISDI